MAAPAKPDPKKPAPAGKNSPVDDQPEVEQVLFQGPLFGREANMKANAKLVQAALVPVKQMISDALNRRAHTILMEPREGRISIRFVIDGVPYPAAAVPGQKGVAMQEETSFPYADYYLMKAMLSAPRLGPTWRWGRGAVALDVVRR